MKTFAKFTSLWNNNMLICDCLKNFKTLKRTENVFRASYSSQFTRTRELSSLCCSGRRENPATTRTADRSTSQHGGSSSSQVGSYSKQFNLIRPLNQIRNSGVLLQYRRLHSDFQVSNKEMNTEEHHTHKESQTQENTGWLIRLANENGYLAWCRNAYIGSVVGVTAYLQTGVPYSKDVSFLFFLLAGGHLLCGTVSYLYHITALRKHIHMSTPTVLLQYTLALGHVMLWLGAVVIYLGYVEEVEATEKGSDD